MSEYLESGFLKMRYVDIDFDMTHIDLLRSIIIVSFFRFTVCKIKEIQQFLMNTKCIFRTVIYNITLRLICGSIKSYFQRI